jgi:hypothetical protein
MFDTVVLPFLLRRRAHLLRPTRNRHPTSSRGSCPKPLNDGLSDEPFHHGALETIDVRARADRSAARTLPAAPDSHVQSITYFFSSHHNIVIAGTTSNDGFVHELHPSGLTQSEPKAYKPPKQISSDSRSKKTTLLASLIEH